MVSRPKMKHRFFHQANLRLAGLWPSLRPKSVGVVPENFFIAMGRPRADAYHCASRNLLAGDISASRRHDALEVDGGSWVHTKGLFKAGMHVGKLLRCGEVDVTF